MQVALGGVALAPSTPQRKRSRSDQVQPPHEATPDSKAAKRRARVARGVPPEGQAAVATGDDEGDGSQGDMKAEACAESLKTWKVWPCSSVIVVGDSGSLRLVVDCSGQLITIRTGGTQVLVALGTSWILLEIRRFTRASKKNLCALVGAGGATVRLTHHMLSVYSICLVKCMKVLARAQTDLTGIPVSAQFFISLGASTP